MDLDKTQKLLQLVIVWLIPVAGPIGIWLVNRSHDEKTGADKWPFGGGASDSGYGPGDGGASVANSGGGGD